MKMEKVRAAVRTVCHLDINRMAEEMNTDKEIVRQVLMKDLNMKKYSWKIKKMHSPIQLYLKENITIM
jgi:hypothetical protein